jgi:hypothetical protein
MLEEFSQPVQTNTKPVVPADNIHQKSKFIFSRLRQYLPSSLDPSGFLAKYMNAITTLSTIL